MGHRKEFLSTPSARRATQTGRDVFRWWMISIHALREEGDRHCPRPRLVEVISIHALREEGDFWWADVPRICIEFLSTPSARRATHRRPAPGSRGSDFYPRPPRGGRPPARSDPRSGSRISIHALREEGDRCGGGKGKSPADFYPRPPRGGRPLSSDWIKEGTEFLSTPSARRATSSRDFLYSSMSISIHALREEGDHSTHTLVFVHKNFYPRPPRGGRPHLPKPRPTPRKFLSTPSARRATPSLWSRSTTRKNFYPRPPRGGRPGIQRRVVCLANFYPRPPRGGRPATTSPHGSRSYFYPRPPRGGRPFLIASRMRSSVFLSTPSARRATAPLILIGGNIMISIHALREEGDHWPTSRSRPSMNFYPRPPRGGRHSFAICLSSFAYFYPRPPRGGRRVSNTYIVMTERFLSTPSARRATAAGSTGTSASTNFYPRPPRGGRRYGRGLEIEQAEFLSTPSARRATFEGHQGNAAGYDFYPRPPRGGRHRS